MQLEISRSQEDYKGLLGGHKGVTFTLSYRLRLSQQEQEIVEQYNLGEYAVTWQRDAQNVRRPDDTINNMLAGRVVRRQDVTTVISSEAIVKDACDELPALFDFCRSFGGTEIIEYPRGAR